MMCDDTKRCRRRGTTGARSFGARRGVTFTEVMFAVILLGIGFIMVAAIFPVAIQQSQANLEDATGMTVARQGAMMMSQLGPVLAPYDPATNSFTYNITRDPPLVPPPVSYTH